MSNHPIAQEVLMAYLDGELVTDRSLIAMTHLEHCAECQELAADLRGLSQKLMAWEVESSTPRIVAEIEAALEKRWQEPGKTAAVVRPNWGHRFTARRWAWAGAFAAVCVVVGLGLKLTTLNRNLAVMQQRTTGLSSPGVAADSNGLFHGLGDHAQDSFSVNGQPLTGQRSRVSTEAGQPAAAPVNGRQISELRLRAKLESPANPANPGSPGPMIARTAGLTVTTNNFDTARFVLDDILKRHHGYIGELSVNTPTGSARNLTATLRVPADQLEATIADLRKLGRVESESQSGEEVTAQYVDLEARLSNARNTEQRLIDLLRERTGKLSDVLAVETEIDRVRGEIESMEAERKNLAKRVDFATINTTVSEDYKEQLQAMPSSTSSRLRNAAVEGYRTMADGILDLVLFLFSYGPSILLWVGLLFLPARALWKRFRRNAAR
jgi:Domain of unknown function (DUF4349)